MRNTSVDQGIKFPTPTPLERGTAGRGDSNPWDNSPAGFSIALELAEANRARARAKCTIIQEKTRAILCNFFLKNLLTNRQNNGII